MWIWECGLARISSGQLIKRLALAVLVTEPSFDLADKISVSHRRVWRFTRWEKERDTNREPNNHIPHFVPASNAYRISIWEAVGAASICNSIARTRGNSASPPLPLSQLINLSGHALVH